MIETNFIDEGKKYKLFLHHESEQISKLIIHDKRFFELARLRLCRQFLTQDSVVVDCGANLGNHAVYFEAHASKVYGIEPVPLNFALLCKNAQGKNIIPIQCVLSDRKRRYSSKLAVKDNYGTFRFVPDNAGDYHSETLDNLIFERVELIKIDCEGCELEILQGASRLLRDYHPILFVEAHGWIAKDHDKRILASVQSFGYKVGKDIFVSGLNK